MVCCDTILDQKNNVHLADNAGFSSKDSSDSHGRLFFDARLCFPAYPEGGNGDERKALSVASDSGSMFQYEEHFQAAGDQWPMPVTVSTGDTIYPATNQCDLEVDAGATMINCQMLQSGLQSGNEEHVPTQNRDSVFFYSEMVLHQASNEAMRLASEGLAEIQEVQGSRSLFF